MTQNKRLFGILIMAATLLLIPFIAMQFTNQVAWRLSDFIIMGTLLLGTGLICELILRKVKNINKRIALCIIAILVFLIIWAELAIGVFGTPFAGS